jgi:chromosome segregation ATPase
MYDDIRDTRPWFWILVLLLSAVAVTGLVIAISAKNSSVDEQKVVDEATAQIKEEVSGLNGALKIADRVQKAQNKEAARARARIKRAVAKAEADSKQRLRKLNRRVAALEEQMTKAQNGDAKLRKDVAALRREQGEMAAELLKINRRLRGISGDGGT